MQVEHNGQMYEFPDGAPQSKIDSFLKQDSMSKLNSQSFLDSIKQEATQGGANVRGGFMRGLSDTADMLSSPKNPVNAMNPGMAVLQLARQQLQKSMGKQMNGGEEKAPTDWIKAMGGKPAEHWYDKNGLQQLIGEGMVPGGEIAGNPVIRKGGMEAAKMLGEVAQQAPEKIKGMMPEGLNPDKLVSEYLEKIGHGTSQENAEKLATLMHKSGQEQNAQHLKMRQEALEPAGKGSIFKEPKENIVEGNMPRLAATFTEGDIKSVKPEHMEQLTKAVREYRKDGDVNKFIDKGMDIFNPLKEMTPRQEHLIENMMETKPNRESNYFKNRDFIDTFVKSSDPGFYKKNVDFFKRPNMIKADELVKGLNAKIAPLARDAKAGKLDANQLEVLRKYNSAKESLEKDMDNVFERFPGMKDKYNASKEHWRKNVLPFKSEGTLGEIYKGKTAGFNPQELTGIFSFPTDEAKTIAGNMGEEGRQAIISNALHGKDLGKFGDVVKNMEKKGGMQDYITDEDRAIAKEFDSRKKHRNYAKGVITTTAFAANPIVGALVGAGLHGKDAMALAKHLLKRK